MISFRKIILYISSLKFAILLIIFIAFSSGIGTFIPQGRSSSEYLASYNLNPIFGFIDGNKILFLELDHIYTSSWFLISLVLLCLSLAACSFRRQIPSLKSSLNWKDYDNEKKFKNLELVSEWEISKNHETIPNIKSFLNKKGWFTLIKKNRISARKGLIGKIGPIVVHIGLIILLIGSAYGNVTHKTKEQYLLPNETLNIINDNSNDRLKIKLKDFNIKRESDGRPIQFISYLEFTDSESNEKESKLLQVNHPIRYKGITIYQADWAISNIVVKIDDILYQLKVKEIPEIGEQVWGILIELGKEIKNNYLLTVDNENGPVRIYKTDDFSEIDIYLDNTKSEINSSLIELIQIIPSSGLIIKNDPSVPFIYFSFFLIMIGTILSLMPSKQIWVFMSDDSKKIYFGGLSNKNLSGFRDEFLKIQSEIRDY